MQRERALHLTFLLPSSPKLMLNVESGDRAELRRETCDCAFGTAGLDLRAHSIRSYEKLTSEGATFLGTDLIRLVEEALPARFGGGPTDYQLVERERTGLTSVSLVLEIERREPYTTAPASKIQPLHVGEGR